MYIKRRQRHLRKRVREYMYQQECETYKELSYLLNQVGYPCSPNLIGKYLNGDRVVRGKFLHCLSLALELSTDQVDKLYEAYLIDTLSDLGRTDLSVVTRPKSPENKL